VFFEENVVEIEVKQIAEGCEIEEGLSDLCFDDFSAVGAELSFEVAFEVVLEVKEGGIGRDLLFLGFNADASAPGNRFCCCSVDPGACFLKLGENIEDAVVADEKFGYCVLKLVTNQVLH